MKRSAAQLESEITEGLKVKPAITVSVKKLFAWEPKVQGTLVDIRESRRSHSTGVPLRVSRLDSPAGAYFILDGHHRAVEAVQAGQPTIAVELDPYLPRIERSGGGYRDQVAGKVNVAVYVKRND